MTTEDTCPVCCEVLLEDEQIHSLECGHTFHCRCIVQWFREHHTCPMCRDEGPPQLDALSLYERIKEMKRIGGRKNAPIILKKMCERAKRAKKKITEHQQSLRQFTSEQSITLRQFRQMTRNVMTSKVRLRSLDRLIGVYNAPGFTMPPLLARHRYY